MGSTPEMSNELFQQHAQGLQALARGLLHDEHAAEDVVQEAWICSAGQAQANVHSPVGWLRQVTRRLALRRRRGEGRRAGHELVATRGDSETSPDLGFVPEAGHDRQILRTVVDALLSLEEPYQSVIHMRFFMDLQPSEIAERRGAPLGTIKSQLSRGLDRLRSRLDRQVGGERGQWALALSYITEIELGSAPPLPLSVSTAAGTSTIAIAKGIAMDWKAWTIASAALAAAIGTTSVGPPTPAGTSSVGTAQGTSALRSVVSVQTTAKAGEAPAARDQESTRTPVATELTTQQLPSRPLAKFEYVLEGHIRDNADWPMAKMKIRVGQPGQVLNEGSYTDEQGRFRIVLRGHKPTAELILAVGDSPYYPSGLWRVDAQAGQSSHLALTVEFNREASEGKRRKFEAQQKKAQKSDGSQSSPNERVSKDKFVAGEVLDVVPNVIKIVGADSKSTFARPIQLMDADGFSELNWPPMSSSRQNVVVNIFKHDVSRERLSVLELNAMSKLALSERKLAGKAGQGDQLRLVVHGSVQTAQGEPVSDVAVVAASIRYLAMAKDGQFVLSIPAQRGQVLRLVAGGGDYGLAELDLDLSTWDGKSPIEWSPTLDRGAELNGSLRTSDGVALDDWHVQYLSAERDLAWSDRTLSKAGRFSIPNLQGGSGQVWLRSNRAQPFPAHVISGLRPGIGEYELIVPAEALQAGQIALQVVDSNGEVLPGSEVRVWQEASGLGQQMSVSKVGFLMEDVPAGRYRIEIGHQASGYRDLGWFNLQPGEQLELGSFILDTPGKLSIDSSGADKLAGWSLVRREGAIDSTVAEASELQDLNYELPAGDYRLFLKGKNFSSLPIELQVKSGAEESFALASAQWQPVLLNFDHEQGTNAPVELDVSDESGRLLTSYQMAAGKQARVHLLPGRYKLSASSGELRCEQILQVGDSGVESHATLSLR